LGCTGITSALETGEWEILPDSKASHPWERAPEVPSGSGIVEVIFVNDLPWDYTVSFDEYTLENIDSATLSEKTFILESGKPEIRYFVPGFHAFSFKSHTDWEHFGYSAIDSVRFEEGYRYRMTFVDTMGIASKEGVNIDKPMEKSAPGFSLILGLLSIAALLVLRRVIK
jgi:hypothetical protein